MRLLSLNFFELHGLAKAITGVNTLNNEMLISKDNKLKGLLNEEITQGAKLELHMILKKINAVLALLEIERIDLLNTCKGDAPSLEKGSPGYIQFTELFRELSTRKNQIEIEPVLLNESRVKGIISEFDYYESIQLLFE